MRFVAHYNLLYNANIVIFQVLYENLAFDLTLIGITGIKDSLRDGVWEAVAKCQKAGVTVKMCAGDNVLNAHLIALQCGIYTKGGIIMDTFAALALATDPASEALLDHKPDKKTVPLFSVEMYKQILSSRCIRSVQTLIDKF